MGILNLILKGLPMLQISHHSILRYAQRFMDMTELESECLNQAQYDMIRNLLKSRFNFLSSEAKIVYNYSDWDCRVVIVNHILVTITKQ